MTEILPIVIALATGAAACATDVALRRVPNVLTMTAAAAAVVLHVATGGWLAGAWSVAGWLAGLALFLPIFLLRGIGGGDVKLLAAFGACLGPGLAVWTGLYGAIAGGLLALGVVVWTHTAARTMVNIGHMLAVWRVTGLRPVEGITLASSRGPRLPYAIPLTCGLVMAVWWRT